MTWRVARDGLRLYASASAVHAVAGVAVAALLAVDRRPMTTAAAITNPLSIIVGAALLVQVVAAIAIARMPRTTPGWGAGIAWAVAICVGYALWLATPYLYVLVPGARAVLWIVASIAWAVQAGLFVVVALAVTRTGGALLALTLGAVALRAAALVAGSVFDLSSAWRGFAPDIANLLVVTTTILWVRRIARTLPPRDVDRIELATGSADADAAAKARDVARHTLALFRRGFVARLASAYTLGLALVLAVSFRGYHVASGVAIAFTFAMLATSAVILIALGGWAVVGGRLGKLAGGLAVADFAAALAWSAIAIFGVELGERAGLIARGATGVIGAAAPLALALSIARVAATEPLAKDARRAAWAIAGFVLAAAAMIVLIVAPIRPRTELTGAVFGTALTTLPSIVLGASTLVALYLLWAVRSAERALQVAGAVRRDASREM